jgi:RimJ/RimL family protein N-acetyltransferase
MNTSEFTTESKYDVTTQRLDINVSVNGSRTTFVATINKEADTRPEWVRLVSKNLISAEATCEVRDGKAYIGHIEAFNGGKGYGAELITGIEQYYIRAGITKFYAYVNHNNVSSKNMFAKLGYLEAIKKREGSFWEK